MSDPTRVWYCSANGVINEPTCPSHVVCPKGSRYMLLLDVVDEAMIERVAQILSDHKRRTYGPPAKVYPSDRSLARRVLRAMEVTDE
jgi:hypothetical protein